jgi:tyrosyl-tRNA synthetase
METDVQIGGTDQLFNLMAGRKLMETYGLRPQVVLTFPILVGTDGVLRMSKSTGNHVGINEAPESIFGKVMSIPDTAMRNYADLVTRWSPAEITRRFAEWETGALHPRDLKLQLAHEIVTIFHSAEAADGAEAHFRRVFQERELPGEMPCLRLDAPTGLIELALASGMAKTRSEVRRLLQQGGIRFDGQPVHDFDLVVAPDEAHVLQIGRRKFLRLITD